MGLKQDIVIRSEYSNNARSKPGGGSRGASPGQYVMRYMAREDATEVLAPVRHTDAYDSAAFTRYMIRSEATERLKSRDDELLGDDPDAYGSPLVLKHRFRKLDRQSGRAFGSKGLSLSHDELVESSDAIQDAFDDGHSVQKIILSFTEEYLRDTGVIKDKFKHKGRGSYMGEVDQLKLRQAIIAGVDNMTRTGQFVKPEWVGTIQLDTSHVHSHIALTDTEFSEARMRDDGADRGKINEREKYMFRKGLHYSLEDMRDLKSFHQQSSLERQNVTAFVKDYTYATLHDNASVQLLMASLPKDRSEWRYGTNRESMKHPNTIATRIVEGVFETDPDASGYAQAMSAVHDYAEESMQKNRLTETERDDLVENGRNTIVERSVNGLYNVLRGVDADRLRTRTPMIDVRSSSDDALARALKSGQTASTNTESDFDPAAFILRVRGYGKREQHHKEETLDHYDLTTEFDDALDIGYVDDSAHVMRVFYEEELRYHMGLTDKYRSFMAYQQKADREAVSAMTPEYDSLVKRYTDITDDEADAGFIDSDARDEYTKDLQRYTMSCFDQGVATLKEWDAVVSYDRDTNTIEPQFVLPVRPKTRSDNLSDAHFKQVKAWDVHHLGLDYYNHPDARIDAVNAAVFANTWQYRLDKAAGAETYTEATGQTLPALTRALDDITMMESVVVTAQQDGLIQTVSIDDLDSSEAQQMVTISADQSFNVAEELRVSLESIAFDLEADEQAEAEMAQQEMLREAEQEAQELE